MFERYYRRNFSTFNGTIRIIAAADKVLDDYSTVGLTGDVKIYVAAKSHREVFNVNNLDFKEKFKECIIEIDKSLS